MLKSVAFRSFLLEAEVHSSEITESVKHFFQFSFSEAFTSMTTAEALWRLPCQWVRIIGREIFLATHFLQKSAKTGLDGQISPKRSFYTRSC
ncbi:hypothetical protein ATY35_11400 [Vibrio cidicii]|uniref:Uncharacterized protein n=1 Tax=Vibrio cidicii TaxID=1763883 RepID=A0ABR5W5S7_9VIBR|nr:hypothetical protein ATY35_11400 [Vibrio cidicii]